MSKTAVLPTGAPAYCLRLLDQRLSNKISEAEFDKEIAFQMLEPICFNEMKPKPYPSKPFLFSEYQKKTFAEKNKVHPDFWLRSDIREYLDGRERIKNQSNAHLYWLRWMQTALPAGDVVLQAKVRERIQDFEVYKYEL